MPGVSRYTSAFTSMYHASGLDFEKYYNVPHSDNGIRKLVSGNNIEWSSTVGLLTCIFGVSFNVTPDYISKK